MLCSRFQNNSFWTDFQNRITHTQEDIAEAIENFKEMVQDCIQDYFANQDAPRTYFLLNKLDNSLQDLFDSLENSKLEANELELLSQLRQKINQDESLRQIREAIACESLNTDPLLLSEEKHCDELSPSKLRRRSSHFTMNKLRRTSTSATERGSLRFTDIGSERKTIIEGLTMRVKESTADVSDHEKKVKLDITFDSDEEDKFEILRMTKIRLDRYLSHHDPHTGNSEEDPKDSKEEDISKIKERFFELLVKMKEDFEEQRIEEAYEGKEKLMEHVALNSSDEQLKGWFELYLQTNRAFISEVELWNKDIQTVLQQLDEEKGYHKYEANKQYDVKYKTQDGKTIIKMESIVNVPVLNILALMYEANGFNKWVPFCKESKLIKPLRRATFAYWLRYGLPAPLTDRECYCLGIGIDRLKKNGSILLISRSVDTEHEIMKKYDIKVPQKGKYMKMDVRVGTEIVPLSETHVKVRVVTSFDAHVKYTSNAVLSWASKKIAKSLFKKFLGKAKNLKGTYWEKKIEENKEFYHWLEEKIKGAKLVAN